MKFYQVDAFAEKIFEGNPAAVYIMEKPPADEVLQKIAMEMNLSETAFLVPENGGYNLRWFTPAAEVELCGHATLAAAHVLFETGRLSADETARFFTLSGELCAAAHSGIIAMDFPAEPGVPADEPAVLKDALGVSPVAVVKNRFDYCVEVKDRRALESLSPDLSLMGQIDCRGIIVTAPGDQEYDFYSRFFAPAVGVPEDPVTGSAHCCLAPYWKEKTGNSRLTARQLSHRGGTVYCEVAGDRVHLAGRAVTTVTGELAI